MDKACDQFTTVILIAFVIIVSVVAYGITHDKQPAPITQHQTDHR